MTFDELIDILLDADDFGADSTLSGIAHYASEYNHGLIRTDIAQYSQNREQINRIWNLKDERRVTKKQRDA